MNYKLITPDYEYTGWEIAPECLVELQKLLISKKINTLNVVEFGSGKSTEVINKFKQENNLDGVIDSFDADPQYSHPIAKIRNIISYNGKPVISFSQQDYSFYEILDGDFSSSHYNLVILDGHHGHGRSVAWTYLNDRLDNGCLVVIDDYDHFPFVDEFLEKFPNSLIKAKQNEKNKKWVIYEILLNNAVY